ncbi:ATP-binding cassette domain-containing protein [Hymenobacter busanensis]|uniref:ATP-binding cassette domain-containing protein n=1 Tax=Hymenobacter busanensis TaxID=2607656 RepID=A0A7L4ZZU8_9BACT|nr:ATP-binding cassette domain-containing protein [Hymenobacter busanensis]KAA9331659.1 ATP-binding cassette domain-containing protein [Hymenobacter busanensis]QHJ08811.1 ATP-binding cassette domain-containing protein [Hymenobacter busanensis]
MLTPPPLVETRGLSFSYGKRPILHDVNLHVPPASIYGFLGPNGAGKSTTLRILLGLLPAPAGSVQLFGHDLAQHRLPLLGRVGALIEMPSLYDHLNGFENVEATRRLRGLPRHRTAEVLTLVGLSADAHRPVRAYSLGMRQRLGLALALLPDPDLLILDEPTNGLDPQGITEMRALLLRLQQEHGKTILLSSHLISEIERMATHVGVIQQGRLAFQGTVRELQRQQSGRAQVVIETDDAERCRNLLPLEFGAARVLATGTLALPYQSPEQMAYLAQELVSAGQPLYSLRCEQPSLEQTFLHLTEATAL